MATTTETLRLLLIGEDKSASKALKGVGTAVQGLTGSLVTGKLLAFGNEAVTSFSQLQDASAAAAVTFGGSMARIEAQAASAPQKLGMSGRQVIEAAGTFGTYGKAAGLAGADLESFAVDMTSLAGDMASFKGKSPEQAIEAIGAALRGEAEPIRQFGVMLDDATLKNRAMSMGLIKTTKDALTPQQKSLAAQAEILAQTSDAQGDFERTSQSAANVQKTLTATMEDQENAIGGKLEPAYTAARKSILDTITAMESSGVSISGVAAVAGPALALVATGWTVSKVAAAASIAVQALAHTQMIAGWVASGGAAIASGAETAAIWLMLKGSAIAGAAATVAANLRAAASWVASNAAMIATSVASKAVAAAQWLVNAAMSANPIGIVVVALAALAAGLVYAYQNSEQFRAIVDGAFKAVAAAGRWLWNNALAPAFRGIVRGFAWVVDGAANMLDALGNVPGFEWAKTAAANMRGLAQGARDAANGIKDIPDATPRLSMKDEASAKIAAIDAKIKALKGKIVTAKANGDSKAVTTLQNKINALKDKKVGITATVKKAGINGIKVYTSSTGATRFTAYARGGRNPRRQLALVGEEGPELVELPAGAYVNTAARTAAIAANSAAMAAQVMPSALVMGGSSGGSGGMGGATIIQLTVNVPRGSDGYAAGRAIREELLKLKNGPLRGVGLGLT